MGLLGSISVAFEADLSKLQSGVSTATGILGGFGGIATAALVGVGAAAVGIGAASVKAAGDFQQGMTQLVTGAGESQSAIKAVSDGILNMSVATGTSTQQLTSGMYMIESAGYHGASGLQVLKVAAEGAKVGNADLGVTANALTTILTDYHMSSSQAASAMNGLTTTVASGKTHLQDLASSLGSVLPLASSLGLSFPQVAGAIATMTNAGMDAQRASQNLANAIRSLASPNATAEKTMKSVGLTAQQLKDTLSTQGLTGAIQLIEDHVGKSFPANSVQAVAAFKNLMGGATGYNVALMLGGKNMDGFKNNVDAVTKSMQAGGQSVNGWNLVQQDFNFKLEQAQQATSVLMIKLGTALLPVLSQLLGTVTPLILQFANWVSQSNTLPTILSGVVGGVQGLVAAIQITITVIQAIYNWFVQWQTPIQIVAGLILLLFLPAMIQAGVQAVIAGTQITTSFITSLVRSGVESGVSSVRIAASFISTVIDAGAQAVASAANIATFVASMITTGVQAVVSGAQVVASFIASMITAGAQAVFAGAKIVASFVASLITTAAQAVVTGATMLASLVPAMISVVAEATVAAVTAIPGLVVAFGAWAAGALAAAVATLAAAAPFIALGVLIAAVVAGIILAIQNWGAITAWITTQWATVQVWFASFWGWIQNAFKVGLTMIQTLLQAAMTVLYTIYIQPYVLVWNYLQNFWSMLQNLFRDGLSGIQTILSNIGSFLYNAFISPFQNAWNFISGIINNVRNALGSIGNTVTSGLHAAGIPGFASGVQNFQSGYGSGGWAIVGENGPELVWLNNGSSVYPQGAYPASFGSSQSASSFPGNSAEVHTHIYFDGTEIAHIVGDRQARLVRLKSGRRVA